jgi:hypothetical protein
MRVSATEARELLNPVVGKYGTQLRKVDKPQCDGITFDSKAEYRRYLMLRSKQQKGQITDLKCHVPYLLEVNGQKVCKYIADFTYYENGTPVVEDVKSRPTRTREFVIKKKLMRAVHGIDVREWPERKKEADNG